MAGGIRDRWTRPGEDENGKAIRVRTPRWGKGKRWQLEWVDDSGKRRSQTYENKDAARRDQAAIAADLIRGRYVDPKNGDQLFRVYAERWYKSRNVAVSTKVQLRSRLDGQILKEFGDMPIRSIKPTDVQMWLAKLDGAGLAASTQRILLGTVRGILSAAENDDVISKSPAARGRVRAPSLSREQKQVWPAEVVHAFREAVPEQYRVAVTLGAGLGLRAGEVFGLAIEDIDMVGGFVHVRRQVLQLNKGGQAWSLPKYGKERRVPLPTEVRKVLAAHMLKYPSSAVKLPWVTRVGNGVDGGRTESFSLLLRGIKGGAMQRAWWAKRVWRPAQEELGLELDRSNGQHALRHFYASTLLAAGEDIVTVAARLGHGDPAFTLRTYTHLLDTDGNKTKAIIDDVLSGFGRPVAVQESDESHEHAEKRG